MATGPVQNLPTSSGLTTFQYDPLNSTDAKPSIRLAVLQPGSRTTSIRVKLVHTTFADRPKYEALSYAWGRADVVKGVELNGRRVEIRVNLWLALVHLRRTKEERLLWIDAICINQADLEERSEQVQIMAYIYSRAKRVLVWLGVIERFDPGPQKTQAEAEEELEAEIRTLAVQPYWWRVWIVQEIGSAMSLEVHWGLKSSVGPIEKAYHGPDQKLPTYAFTSRSQSWARFFRRMKDSTNAAVTLAQQRKGRHGDDFLLANLMEACQQSECEEPRDKVYGFVGIAHDCQDDKFLVDYSKSLFELYEDVIRFHLRSQLDSRSVVYFSQLVQQLFGGASTMRADLKTSRPLPSDRNPERVPVVAHLYGIVTLVGPSYSDFIALPEATRQWKAALTRGKPMNNNPASMYLKPTQKKKFFESLRKNNENLAQKLYNLDPSNLNEKVTTLGAQIFWDGCVATDDITSNRSASTGSLPATSTDSELGPWKEKQDEPRLFSTDNGIIGLLPPQAQLHDVLFRFQKSEIVAVVRAPRYGTGTNESLRLIGRALAVPGKSSPDDFSMDEATTLTIDIRALQLLTA